MFIKKLIYLVLVLGLTLQGCSPIQDDETITPALEETPSPVVLEGQSLSDLGLSVVLEHLQPVADPNNPDYEPYFTLVNLTDTDEVLQNIDNASALGLKYSDNLTDMRFMPMICLQAFEKLPDTETKQLIMVDGQAYRLAELESTTLFEDDRYIVLNITEFLPTEFSQRLEVSKRILDYDYEWLNDVHQYISLTPQIQISPEHQDPAN